MSTHLLREVEKLKEKILALTAVVEASVTGALNAVGDRNVSLAQDIVDGDAAIDASEVDIEEDCLKILALYQPVASDLRFIIAALKVNNDIERVGDLAVNIAERALALCTQPPVEVPLDLKEMEAKALAMLRESLESLVQQDTAQARRVRAMDDEVDAIHHDKYEEICEAISENPDQTERLLSHLSISRHLERIADYATNIAEDVIYFVEGEIVRHKPTLPTG